MRTTTGRCRTTRPRVFGTFVVSNGRTAGADVGTVLNHATRSIDSRSAATALEAGDKFRWLTAIPPKATIATATRRYRCSTIRSSDGTSSAQRRHPARARRSRVSCANSGRARRALRAGRSGQAARPCAADCADHYTLVHRQGIQRIYREERSQNTDLVSESLSDARLPGEAVRRESEPFIRPVSSRSTVHVSGPLAVANTNGSSGERVPDSHSTCAVASVACPQRSTSTLGVNQRNGSWSPVVVDHDEGGLGEVHLGRDREHPRVVTRGVQHAHRGRVAAERLLGEGVDLEERRAHSMTTSTSPVPTVSPSATRISCDRARLLGVDVVLHLHRLEHEHRLTGFDRVAGGDEHLDDRALHRRADGAAPRRTAGAAGARARSGGPLPRRRRLRARRASGSQSFTEKRLPLTSTGTVRSSSGLGLRRSSPRRRGRGRRRRRTRRRRPRPRPTSSSASTAAKSGCDSSATCAGMVVRTPRDLELAQRAQHAVTRRLAVGGPHDELADQVVVVLRDGVALRVAAVPAHAGTAREPQAGDGAG